MYISMRNTEHWIASSPVQVPLSFHCSTYNMRIGSGNDVRIAMMLCVINFFYCCSYNRKLSSQQKELIRQFARTENLTSGTVDGVSFEQEEGQWGRKNSYADLLSL